MCSNGWNLLINTRINLNEIILICKLFCCSILPCSLNEFLGAIWAKCRHDCPKILSFWNSFSFIFAKYELRSSISCTRGHIFAILSSLYFGTTMYFTSLVLNTYKINGIKISDAPFSSLQGLLSWNPMMSFDNLEGNIALNKKKFMIDVLRSAVSKLYKSRLLPNFPNSSSGGW